MLTQTQAQLIDEELMGDDHKFSLDQLMELAGKGTIHFNIAHTVPRVNCWQHFAFLIVHNSQLNAGLSCASAITKEFPPSSHPRVLLVCGPGSECVWWLSQSFIHSFIRLRMMNPFICNPSGESSISPSEISHGSACKSLDSHITSQQHQNFCFTTKLTKL
jgi:hypothetical protein